HDQEEALTMADRIVVMNHGVIEQIGTPEEIYRDPASAFVADFIGQMNFAPGTIAEHGGVRLGDIELACEINGFAPGAEVTLAVRPEDIRFDPSSTEGGNVFKVRVAEIEFLGSFFRATLESPGLGSIRLIADLPINTARRLDIREGYEIAATIPPEFIRLYEGEGRSG
ncbi:MAG: TOBE domain-containing protein, partial [Rhodovibrionaceae bacterium]